MGSRTGASRAPARGEEVCSSTPLLTEGRAEAGRAPKLTDLIPQSWSGQAGLTPEAMGSEHAKPAMLPGKATHLEAHPTQSPLLSFLPARPLLCSAGTTQPSGQCRVPVETQALLLTTRSSRGWDRACILGKPETQRPTLRSR